MYLIDGPPMRYDSNLFQFLLNLMKNMCLVQESVETLGLGGWNWMSENVSSNNKKELEHATICW